LSELVLSGRRAIPTALHDSGFEFEHRTLSEALAAEMA
jgi:NAD dependent epimerase/dehydratase family enzyme